MASKEMSVSSPVSRRNVSSRFTTEISSSPPFGASRSSQWRNRTIAAPSRRCAVRAPSRSAAFLRAFGRIEGSCPSTIFAPVAARRALIASDVHTGSSWTAAFAAPSASSAAAKSDGGRTSVVRFRCARTSSGTRAGSMNTAARPVRGTMAWARTTGVCGTSRPRMLNSQARQSGIAITSASTLRSPRPDLSVEIFSSVVTPANCVGCTSMGVDGRAGRSVQTASTRFGSTARRAAPAGSSARAKRAMESAVISHGSYPATSPALRLAASHFPGGSSTR